MTYTPDQIKLLSIALKAQAIGDAIGEDFEFQNEPEKSELYDLIENPKYSIHITDDTQMTMFGIEAMLNGGSLDQIKEQYLLWLRTQRESKTRDFPTTLDLFDQKKMWQVRAPGNTCLHSLQLLRKGDQVSNNSNGCGTVMKALPFLFEDTPDLLINASLMTHQGPVIADTARLHWEVAQKLINKQLPNLHLGKSLKEVFGDGGWQAHSCLDIAIWAFEHCDGDFNKLLELSILHSGDSDSVAATAGALYGLYYESFPDDLYNRIYEHDVIDMLLGKFTQNS